MAKRLTLKQKNWLLSLHLLFIVAWMGGAMCMLVLGIYGLNVEEGERLAFTYEIMHVVDEAMLKYSALGTLFTGVLLSVKTHWGLTKHYWIIVKEVVTAGLILLGIFGLSNWLGESVLISGAEKAAALQNDDFVLNSRRLVGGAAINIVWMFVLIAISYFKPWGKRKERQKKASST